MTTTRQTWARRVLLCTATIALLTMPACGTAGAPSAPASPTAGQTAQGIDPPDETDAAASAALAAYVSYWETTDAALAAPGSRDWRSALEAVSHGQALNGALAEIENFQSLPAHAVGRIDRAPSVSETSTETVTILDCVDVGEAGVISDGTGERLDDLENRVERFRLRAQVVISEDRQWRVAETIPALDEPC